jgi:hypothetical protein
MKIWRAQTMKPPPEADEIFCPIGISRLDKKIFLCVLRVSVVNEKLWNNKVLILSK